MHIDCCMPCQVVGVVVVLLLLLLCLLRLLDVVVVVIVLCYQSIIWCDVVQVWVHLLFWGTHTCVHAGAGYVNTQRQHMGMDTTGRHQRR